MDADDGREASRDGGRILRTVCAVAAALVLVGGTATATSLVTGKQIKNGSVTSKDIKDGDLRVKDIKKGQRDKLRGPVGSAGPSGVQGPLGPSAFSPPPAGALVTGAFILNEEVQPGTFASDFVDLPFTPAVPLLERTNLWFGAGRHRASPPPRSTPRRAPGQPKPLPPRRA